MRAFMSSTTQVLSVTADCRSKPDILRGSVLARKIFSYPLVFQSGPPGSSQPSLWDSDFEGGCYAVPPNLDFNVSEHHSVEPAPGGTVADGKHRSRRIAHYSRAGPLPGRRTSRTSPQRSHRQLRFSAPYALRQKRPDFGPRSATF